MGTDIQIRLADGGDAETIAGFNVAMARETEGKELSAEVAGRGVRVLLENPRHGFYVVAEAAGEVVGSLMVTYEWSDWRCGVFWWIQSVYIRGDFRRQGVFSRLYGFLKEAAGREGDVCGLRLYVERSNAGAEAAYRTAGMTRTNYGIFEEEFERSTENE